MGYRSLLFGLCWFQLLAVEGKAQQRTVVQLPTFQRFSSTTSVIVPDQGRAYIAGMSRGGQRSMPAGRHSSSGTGHASISAFVHDFQAMDRAILSQARARRENTVQPVRLSTSTPHDKSRPKFPSRPTASSVRASQSIDQKTQEARARADFELALRLEAKGQSAPALAMYKAAQKRATGQLAQQVAKSIRMLTPQPPETRPQTARAATPRSPFRDPTLTVYHLGTGLD